jgi:hypothetical protein
MRSTSGTVDFAEGMIAGSSLPWDALFYSSKTKAMYCCHKQ